MAVGVFHTSSSFGWIAVDNGEQSYVETAIRVQVVCTMYLHETTEHYSEGQNIPLHLPITMLANQHFTDGSNVGLSLSLPCFYNPARAARDCDDSSKSLPCIRPLL